MCCRRQVRLRCHRQVRLRCHRQVRLHCSRQVCLHCHLHLLFFMAAVRYANVSAATYRLCCRCYLTVCAPAATYRLRFCCYLTVYAPAVTCRLCSAAALLFALTFPSLVCIRNFNIQKKTRRTILLILRFYFDRLGKAQFMSGSTATQDVNSLNRDVLNCKLFYLAKYAAGILFILSAAVFPIWVFFALCLAFFVLAFTPLLPKTAALFRLTEEDKLRKLSFDFRLLTGILALSFLAVLFFNDYSPFPGFLIFQALAVTIFSTRSWFCLLNRVTLYESACETDRFKNISLHYEFVLILLRVIGAFLVGVWVAAFTGFDLTQDFINQLFFIAIIGAFVGSLFESIPSRVNANASIYIGSLISLWMLYLLGHQAPVMETALAAAFSVVLAFLAYRYKIADVSALFSAVVLGVLIILFTNLWWFILLLAFFILGGGFTKFKFKEKQKAGLAEAKSGIRSYENVFSNSFWALVAAVLFGIVTIYPEWSWLAMPLAFAYVGTIATATGDTMASEIGVTAKGPTYMITNFRKAKAGEDGGVSLLGLGAALLGSAIIGVLAFVLGIIGSLPLALAVAIFGGFIGTNIDSVLGAVVQKRGWLTNSGVNFVSTFLGALISFAAYFVLFSVF